MNKTRPNISICIPAYEMGNDGAKFLKRALQSLATQNFRDFDVVVSDQSSNNAVAQECQNWESSLNIKHIWNRNSERKSSTNVNFALNHANGEILKVLFQDDFFCSDEALERIYSTLSVSSKMWLLCGSGICSDGITVEKQMVPRLNKGICFGNNTVSSPSVVAIKSECRERFDERLIWLMDVEYYQRLWSKYGTPEIIAETMVANGIHSGQVSSNIDLTIQKAELVTVWQTHRSTLSFAEKFEYYRRRLKLFQKTLVTPRFGKERKLNF